MVVCRRFGDSRPILVAALFGASLLVGGVAAANTITVNTSSDTTNASDGLCTLHEAIIAANTNTASGGVAGECAAGAAGADTIQFAIPGAGVKTIFLLTELPAITEALTINGFTQTGASPNSNATGGLNTVLTVELNGSATAVSVGSLIVVLAGPTTIRGLAINAGNGTNHSGISIAGSGGVHVEGC